MKIGKVSESVLKRSVLKQIQVNKDENIKMINGAGVGADCAIFAFDAPGHQAVCMQEGTVQGPDDAVRIIHRSVNGLACCGIRGGAVLLALLLPERAEEEEIRKLMQAASAACQDLHILIAGGHTAVSGEIRTPRLAVTALGMEAQEKPLLPGGARPGQDIVVSKWIGLEGTARIAAKEKEKLLSRYPSHLVETAAAFGKYISILPEAATAVKSNVSAMHDVSEGGIFRALWELAESAGVGLTIDLKKLPVRQETIEVCEFFGISPYELSGGGSLVMTARDGENLVKALEQEHIPARIVGKITDSNDRIVTNEDEVRFLERPRSDEIYKVIAE